MNVKITRKTCLDSWSNSTCSGEYWLIHARAYNHAGDRFYKLKFVLFLDPSNDLWDPETEQDLDHDDVLNDMIASFVDVLSDVHFDDEPVIRWFYDECNYTIERYNDSPSVRRW